MQAVDCDVKDLPNVLTTPVCFRTRRKVSTDCVKCMPTADCVLANIEQKGEHIIARHCMAGSTLECPT